jgi:magnesium-transporting ATPase (P-type)
VGIAVSTATDVAKGAASVVLTEAGLTNIVALVEQGRTIYQRILTWIVNKISRTILKAAFVAIAFVVTGKFVVSAFAMLLLVFLTDFAKISLSTDNVRRSKNPETWNIGGFITVSVVLGIAMVAETLFLLWIGWTRFGLATNDNGLTPSAFSCCSTSPYSPSCPRGSAAGSGRRFQARPSCRLSLRTPSWAPS